jgi:hypothetical protein
MAKLGEMKGYVVGRWVAKLGEMGGYVGSAPACYGSSVGLNPDISQNLKVSKGAANTLYSPPKIYKQRRIL